VEEVFSDIPQEWLLAVAAETGYMIDQEQLLLKGVCASCKVRTN
jgi:Fur family peroxide stress response transcriptional regulator